MKAKLVLGASVVAAASLFVAGRAEAADAGSLSMASKGSLIISADRLFGVSFWSARDKYTDPAGRVAESKVSYTKVGLLWGDPSAGFVGFANPFAIPRASVDFLVIDGLTIGGSVGFLSGSSKSSSTVGGTTVESDGPTLTEFAIAPRIGYILGFSPNVGLWLRGGFTFWSASSKSLDRGGPDYDQNTYSGFALNLEPTLILAPIEHFAFTAGIVGDIGVTGKAKSESVDRGVTTIRERDLFVNNFGLMLGILGWI